MILNLFPVLPQGIFRKGTDMALEICTYVNSCLGVICQ